MAQFAIARSCPYDGTLVTYSGSYADADLMGQCPCCKQSLTIPNPSYVAPPAGAIPPAIAAQVALLSPAAQDQLLADLQALTAAQAVADAAAAAEPVESALPPEPTEPDPVAATVTTMETTSG